MYKKTYTFDISEFQAEVPIGHAKCKAEEGEGEWLCDLEFDIDLSEFSSGEVRSIRQTLREQFEGDLKREFGATLFHWKGDRRSPLLRLKKGDRVSFKDGEGEVVYVIPEAQKYGIKTTDGRVLNFNLKSLEHFLFKKL
jgi:hypothetical protein